MERIPLDTAVRDIVRSTLESGRQPFFFIVGAGVSAPQIKLASDITAECKAHYEELRPKFGLPEIAPTTSDPIETYSFWFERAYPQPHLRARYLEELMRDKPISDATLRLAHLLSSRKLLTIVVTPNFDDFLYRALLLLDEPPVICDHPRTISRIDLDRKNDIQIIHVHGTYKFYDCCNLRAEITERSASEERTLSMVDLLARVLARRSPIVIGYSGWEGDVIMTALRRSLLDRPPSNVYWFCHSAADANRLPDWLMANAFVRLIVPDDRRSEVQLGNEEGELQDDERRQASQDEQRIDAVDVVERLSQVLQISAPLIASDPFTYLIDRLQQLSNIESINRPETASAALATRTFYDFGSVVARLRRAQEAESRQQRGTETVLEGLRNLLRGSQYKDAAAFADANIEQFISAGSDELEPFLRLYVTSVKGIERRNPSGLEASNKLVRFATSAHDRLDDNSEIRQLYLSSLLDRARRLSAQHRHEECIQALDVLLKQVNDSDDKRDQVTRLDVLYGKALQMDAVNRSKDVYPLLQDILLDQTDGTEAKSLRGHALLFKADTEAHEGLHSAARDDYVRFIREYGDDPHLSSHTLDTYVRACRAAYRSGSYDQSVALAHEALDKFLESSDPSERAAVKRIYVPMGVALNRSKQPEAALEALSHVLEADEKERALLGKAPIDAMQNAARILSDLKRYHEARALYERIIADFGQSDDAYFKRSVERARKRLEPLSAQMDDKVTPEK